jgi:hypothetical protein
LAADFPDKRIAQLVQHLNKCLNHIGEYTENEHVLYLIVTLKLFGEEFEVFTAVTMKNGVFWVVTPCGA